MIRIVTNDLLTMSHSTVVVKLYIVGIRIMRSGLLTKSHILCCSKDVYVEDKNSEKWFTYHVQDLVL